MQNACVLKFFVHVNPGFHVVINCFSPHKRLSMITGFTETRRGCCGTGLREVALLCNALTPLCKNVSSYVFFDAVHPTERVYKLVNDYIVKDVIPQF
jgi:hypothetical protein